MFKLSQLFKRADTIQRHLAAPLARSRLTYLAHRAEHGAKASTLRGIAALQLKVIHYLELGEEGKVAWPEIEAAAQRWVSQDPARRGGNPHVARRHFVSHATCWLRFSGRLEDLAVSTHPHFSEVAEFAEYMRQERGWSEATIRDRRARADDFLRRFCTRTGALAEVTIATIDRALNEKNARDGRPRCRATIRTHADALRAFFRFAEGRGWIRSGLAAAIVTPRVYRDAALPVGPSWEEQGRLLATTEGDRPADLRDRAILLTLSAYGLRVGEARGLQLDDIDWEAQTLRVRRPKTTASTCFRCRAASETPLHAISARPDRRPMSGRSFLRSRRRSVPSAPPRYRASCEAACSAATSIACIAERTRCATPSPSVCWTRGSRCRRSGTASGIAVWTPPRCTPRSTLRACAKWPTSIWRGWHDAA